MCEDCCGKDTTLIYADNSFDALIKAYSYFGEDYRLTSNEMRTLFSKCDFKRACEIFENFSGSEIILFSEISDDPLINRLK